MRPAALSFRRPIHQTSIIPCSCPLQFHHRHLHQFNLFLTYFSPLSRKHQNYRIHYHHKHTTAAAMDTLVAKYSRPAAFHKETYTEDQQDDLQNDMAPSLSLNFAMPPVAQVSFPSLLYHICKCINQASNELTKNSPRPGSAPPPTTARTPTAPSRSPTAPRRWPSGSRGASS